MIEIQETVGRYVIDRVNAIVYDRPERILHTLMAKKVDLTFTQYRIFSILSREPSKVFSRELLVKLVGKNIAQHIYELRKIIDPDYIVTIYGKGWKFNTKADGGLDAFWD